MKSSLEKEVSFHLETVKGGTGQGRGQTEEGETGQGDFCRNAHPNSAIRDDHT